MVTSCGLGPFYVPDGPLADRSVLACGCWRTEGEPVVHDRTCRFEERRRLEQLRFGGGAMRKVARR